MFRTGTNFIIHYNKGSQHNLSTQLREASYFTIHFCSLLTAIFPNSMYPLHSLSHIIRVKTSVVWNSTPCRLVDRYANAQNYTVLHPRNGTLHSDRPENLRYRYHIIRVIKSRRVTAGI
jgi:hypothetical protein